MIKLSVIGSPFITESCNKIQNSLNISCKEYNFEINKYANSELIKPTILFNKITKNKLDELKIKFNKN